ncbi:LacI family DNA-binding transcriptional regulator [Aurantibacter crassamenti]|uniref:LacI family DNA-binding transcriptional regulator n=1 Tax=Aurantibacter crassamenti TaxID=1837375 RepID=UPI00193A52E4|nr:LacI family DNA-binding transcriptional regulator [Aurantibacter crassamenti]MBM1106505.1 LacI family DNA-binding transcriptional regulator [Aurantibacter crassamenti]
MSIKRIAKLANVSIGTVDRVLHNRTGVSKETERRVLEIIKETGYVRNTTASRLKLASLKKIKIAVLFPEAKHNWNYWKLPKKGITKAVNELNELGVVVDEFLFFDSTSFRNQADKIVLDDYDALVTVAFFKEESNVLLQKANAKKVPLVFIDTEMDLDSPANFIRQDSIKAGMVAGRLLHGLVGETGQYFVVNMLNDRGIHANNKQRESGFRAYFDKKGIQVPIKTINYSMVNEFEVTEEMKIWFDSEGPKGIFVTNSKSHLLPEIFETYNVTNTSIVGFDVNKSNLKYLKKDKINFLIHQQPRNQGYAAIKGLFDFLTKGDAAALNLDIPVEIVVKENVPSSK